MKPNKYENLKPVKGWAPLHQDGKTIVVGYWTNKLPEKEEWKYCQPSSPDGDIEWVPVITIPLEKYKSMVIGIKLGKAKRNCDTANHRAVMPS